MSDLPPSLGFPSAGQASGLLAAYGIVTYPPATPEEVAKRANEVACERQAELKQALEAWRGSSVENLVAKLHALMWRLEDRDDPEYDMATRVISELLHEGPNA